MALKNEQWAATLVTVNSLKDADNTELSANIVEKMDKAEENKNEHDRKRNLGMMRH